MSSLQQKEEAMQASFLGNHPSDSQTLAGYQIHEFNVLGEVIRLYRFYEIAIKPRPIHDRVHGHSFQIFVLQL